MSSEDIHGSAILDYINNSSLGKLWINNNYGVKEKMPIATYLRNWDEFPQIEQFALSMAKGKVLDIGAGAGAHSLYLQENGRDVTSVERSPGCIKTMKQRGVLKSVECNIYDTQFSGFDCVICLMNGVGLAGKDGNITSFFKRLASFIHEQGYILIDSSDISYLEDEKGTPIKNGEVRYQFEYNGLKGEWFDWVYANEDTVLNYAEAAELHAQIVANDDTGHFLAMLQKKVMES